MITYTIQCGYDTPYSATVVVEADNLGDACQNAIEKVAEEGGWDSLDHCGDTYIDAAAEGAGVDPWDGSKLGSTLEIPSEYSALANLMSAEQWRLWRAAPALLEELEHMIALWDGAGDCQRADEVGDFVTNNFDAADAARDTIAKAKRTNR